MEKTNKKFKINKKAVIIAGIILFCLIVPKITLAVNPLYLLPSLIPGVNKALDQIVGGVFKSVGKEILIWLGQTIQYFLSWLLKAAAALFEAMFNIGFDKSSLDVMKIGWKACRDFANMFFILFMVIIAFATILRLEQYGIKKLLPKVIGVALLINFSLVFCSIIIDFSNIAADFFIKDIKNKTNSITGTLGDALNIGGVVKTYNNCDDMKNQEEKRCNGGIFTANFIAAPRSVTPEEKQECLNQVEKLYQDCQKYKKSTGQNEISNEDLSFLNIMLAVIVGSIVLLIAAFTLFAGAIMILFRIIALWFLVTISPLVFLCYIMPGLKANWQKWWKTFLNWCIFAPAYAFFVWMALQIATRGATKGLEGLAESPIPGDWGMGANSFMGNPGPQLVSYFIIIGFLIGGLIVAKTLGIYGANAVMAIGQKWGKGARDWAGRTAFRPARWLGAATGASVLTAGGKLFGGRLGGRMQARASLLRQSWWEKDPKYQKLAKVLANAPNDTVLKNLSALGPTGILASKEVMRRQQLIREMNTNYAMQVDQHIRSVGDPELLQKFRELRVDVLESQTDVDKIMDKLTQEGNLNKIPAIVFQNERVVKAMARLASPKQIESLRDVSPQHATILKDTLGKLAVAGAFDKIHEAYASQTGDIGRMSDDQAKKWAEQAGAEGIKRINITSPVAKIKIVAQNIPDNQVDNIVGKIQNGEVAKIMAEHLNETKPNLVAESFFLKGLIKKGLVKNQAVQKNVVNLKDKMMTKEEALDEIKKESQKLEEEMRRKKDSGSITDKSITD